MEDQLAALRRKLKAAIEEENAIIEDMAILRAEIAAAKSGVAAVSGGSEFHATVITGIPTPPLEVATSLPIPSAATATNSAPSGRWFKFDDERVTKEDVKRALEEQYGGGEEEFPQTNPGYNTPFKFTKYSNAYKLMYIRVSDKDKIICEVDETDIAEHLPHQGGEEMLVPNSDIAQGPIVEGPQPMKVVSVENAGTVGIQASDEPPPSCFTWTIENFSRVNVKKLYSQPFTVGGYKWRVLIFPKGNNVDFLSMYLDVAESTSLPYGWNRYARFSLTVVSQMHDKLTMKKDARHQFNQRESDWGFTSFMPLGDFYDPNKGYLLNDTCVIQGDVSSMENS